jgi:hypothetical protein
MNSFDLKMLYEVESKEQYCIEVWNKFAALATEEDINSAWETITISKFQPESV